MLERTLRASEYRYPGGSANGFLRFKPMDHLLGLEERASSRMKWQEAGP